MFTISLDDNGTARTLTYQRLDIAQRVWDILQHGCSHLLSQRPH